MTLRVGCHAIRRASRRAGGVAFGEWNHAEGFRPNPQPGQADAGYGGWFTNDNGEGLTIDDVHVCDPNPSSPRPVWASFAWNSPYWNGGATATFRRMEGYMRPSGLALPTGFGISVHPTKRPSGYDTNGTLADDEVAHGAIHRMLWNPSSTTISVQQTILLAPTANDPRGGYCVTGMCLCDLTSASEGDELIVTTLAGDVYVYAADTLTLLDRTRVLGAAGCYNSIAAEDLNGDGMREVYIGGSRGLHRFVQQEESL